MRNRSFTFLACTGLCLAALGITSHRSGGLEQPTATMPTSHSKTMVPKVSSARKIIAPTPTPTENLTVLVRSLTHDLYTSGIDYTAREKDLRAKIADQVESDWLLVSDKFVRDQFSGDEKRAALYLLGLAGQQAIPALTQIAASRPPKTLSEEQQDFEISIRLDALEKLDLLASDSPSAQSGLAQVAEAQTDESVRFYVQIAMMGIQQGRPGKLHRLMEAALKERGG